MKTLGQPKELAVDILMDIAGGILIALGTYNFAAAAEFPMVGFNGIGLILYHLFGLPIGTVALILNIPVAILCWRILGKQFLLRSLRTIVITSLIMDLVAPLFPVYTGDRMLAAICTGVLSGLGYALIYLRESSTGGSDFIIMSIRALKPHLSLGNISLAMESSIILLGTILVSKNVDGFIYGMIINVLLSTVLDKVMCGVSRGKIALVVTDFAKSIGREIDRLTGRGCTFLKAEGSFTQSEKDVVMCACSNKQMVGIRRAVKKIDPDAFLIILDSNEVVGEGFQKA
ncbi:MAG: YitT family protein [Firmicutes bacterium]|nr:YitT family protein [Bacillota bacterium]MDD7602867.1 YitT family protein [Bacillota bacterium]MDY5856525.1 YitT family protein [Anaerovoracaceae bacterium]